MQTLQFCSVVIRDVKLRGAEKYVNSSPFIVKLTTTSVLLMAEVGGLSTETRIVRRKNGKL